MKTSHKIFILIPILILLLAVLFSYHPSSKNSDKTTPPIPSSIGKVVLSDSTADCHILNNDLPDKNCTPGAIDPNVTQDNIDQTICVSGYSKSVRPPASYTNKLKVQQITSYGYSDFNTKDYEEDHLISLELGGAPKDPKNLWPEPGDSPNPKDKVENLCHKRVCLHQITLALAQQQIATNWHSACQ